MINEFRTLDGACTDLVPQGPGYENVGLSNQVCTTVGSQPGQAFVNGNLHLQLTFGYSSSNLWRVSFLNLCRNPSKLTIMDVRITRFS
jgi:ATP-binding cassette subfamily G (WHITE) protein 2 (SNQ2)